MVWYPSILLDLSILLAEGGRIKASEVVKLIISMLRDEENRPLVGRQFLRILKQLLRAPHHQANLTFVYYNGLIKIHTSFIKYVHSSKSNVFNLIIGVLCKVPRLIDICCLLQIIVHGSHNILYSSIIKWISYYNKVKVIAKCNIVEPVTEHVWKEQKTIRAPNITFKDSLNFSK